MEEKETRSLEPWDPFAELEAFGRWPWRSGRPSRLLGDLWGAGRGFAPAVDVTENDKQYTVTVEVPGAAKEDVTVEVEHGMLTIRGEKRREREEKGEHRRLVERSYGTFSRSFSLPADADAERVQARFADGVLTVQIQKSEQAKPKTVDIKS